MRERIFVTDPAYDQLDLQVLRERLLSTKTERARAMGALARRAGRDASLRPIVWALLKLPAIRDYRTMGTVSLAHIGVACLWMTGDETVRAELRSMVESWPAPDRTDLLWFLQSQEIQLGA